jgi:thiamine-monophosphate kinase
LALRQAFLRPVPRVSEGRILVKCGVRTAIDISDGLVSDLGHICKASRLSARIMTADVPVAPAVKTSFGPKALSLALSGGDDYELLFTAPAPVIDKAKVALRARDCPVNVIGEMLEGRDAGVVLLDDTGKQYETTRAGWDHFAAGKHGA